MGSAGAREALWVVGKAAGHWPSGGRVTPLCLSPRPAEEWWGPEEEAQVPLVQHLVPEEQKQDPRVAAWRGSRPSPAGGEGMWGAGAAPPSLWGLGGLNKETDHVAWVPCPMWSRAPGQPMGLGHVPFLHQRGCAHGLEKTLILWAWLGPSETGI